MIRFWFKGISYLSVGVITIRYWEDNNDWWADSYKVKEKRTGIRIVR